MLPNILDVIEEIKNTTVEEWLDYNPLSIKVYKNKYSLSGETLYDWIFRVSGGSPIIMVLIYFKLFVFAGRILSNRGITGVKNTYSNCYVEEPPEDSIESIYDSRKNLARTYSYGGGCGIDVSKLAPKGAKVGNQAKESSGAVSFLDGYSKVAEEIGQNGRRGALMISINDTHPDLLDFIDAKTTSGAVEKANISVRISDKFMEAVYGDMPWELEFTRKETGEKISKTVKAKEVFRKLSENNRDWAEPGILFWDTIENYNLLDTNEDFAYAGVNPCAEEPLPAGGSCLLGSVNLSEFVKNPYTEMAEFDYEYFDSVVKLGVIALNQVLDEGIDLHPLEIQKETARDWRQIGLGITGLADMLIKLGVEYGDKESLDICHNIGNHMACSALEASTKLAEADGTYPRYDERVLESSFFKVHCKKEDYLTSTIKKNGLRNSQLLTCAPTGSISLLLGCSNGIEPLFSTDPWIRKTESLHGEDVYYEEYPKVLKELLENGGDITSVPSAHTIAPINRIKMQSVWQRHIDASISSTINLPEKTTTEEIEDIYMAAWEHNLKGLTIYRDGCKRDGILNSKGDKSEEIHILERGEWKEKPNDTIYYPKKLAIGCGKVNLFIGWSEETKEIIDIYVKKSGAGGCEKLLETTAIAYSAILRIGGNVDLIRSALEGVNSCPSVMSARGRGVKISKGTHCGAIIVNVIDEFIKEKLGMELTTTPVSAPAPIVEKEKVEGKVCPECGDPINFEGGCGLCHSCGWTKCE